MTPEVRDARGAGEALALRLAGSIAPDRLRVAVPLAPYTTFRIGGPADVLYDATSGDDLANIIGAARAAGVPYRILGLGANILVGDGGIRGLVIRNAQGAHRIDGTRVTADSGVVVGDLIAVVAAHGLGGLEHYAGIPSTVGGALWQNLHFLSPAPARERTMYIAEVVETVELLNPAGGREWVAGTEMRFGYDTSRLHGSGEVALRATFSLAMADRATLERVSAENRAWRAERHPPLTTEPSAGSIFKKIEGVGAGRLVDQCGLKGYAIGGAQVSRRHANFIVNAGGATARDVRALITHVQDTVERAHGVRLEPEIGFVGEF